MEIRYSRSHHDIGERLHTVGPLLSGGSTAYPFERPYDTLRSFPRCEFTLPKDYRPVRANTWRGLDRDFLAGARGCTLCDVVAPATRSSRPLSAEVIVGGDEPGWTPHPPRPLTRLRTEPWGLRSPWPIQSAWCLPSFPAQESRARFAGLLGARAAWPRL
jgi:hypothetical protein